MRKLKEFLQQKKERMKLQIAKAEAIGDENTTMYYNGCLDMIEWTENWLKRKVGHCEGRE